MKSTLGPVVSEGVTMVDRIEYGMAQHVQVLKAQFADASDDLRQAMKVRPAPAAHSASKH